jgi:hypothetical protein
MFFSTIGLTGSVTLEQYKIYRVRFMVLTPLSTIFQLYRDGIYNMVHLPCNGLWRPGPSITLMDFWITSVFTSRVYCWVSQTLQIINTYFIRFQNYCDTSYSRGSVNQMWILKFFTDMLGYIQPWHFSSCNSIKILSSLPSTQLFPHSKLKNRLKQLVQLCLIKKQLPT